MDEKKKSWSGETVDVLTAEYEKGRPGAPQRWAKKLGTRKEMLAYLDTAERYWSGVEGFGSEKRKNPA